MLNMRFDKNAFWGAFLMAALMSLVGCGILFLIAGTHTALGAYIKSFDARIEGSMLMTSAFTLCLYPRFKEKEYS